MFPGQVSNMRRAEPLIKLADRRMPGSQLGGAVASEMDSPR
jgi:hypothetical protein